MAYIWYMCCDRVITFVHGYGVAILMKNLITVRISMMKGLLTKHLMHGYVSSLVGNIIISNKMIVLTFNV